MTRSSWLLIFLLLLLTGLAAPRLTESVWIDEQRTLYYIGAVPQYGPISPTEQVDRIAENRWQAPVYYFILSAWGQVAGWSPFVMRVLSLYAGIIAVAGVYALVKREFSGQVGLYAAFTMGVSAFYVHYLHEMRTYSLMVLLVVMTAWAYGWVIRGKSRLWLGYALLTVSLAGNLYAHYFGIFPVAALGLVHVASQWRKPRFWPVIACFVLAGLSFTPWLGVLWQGAQLSTEDERNALNMTALGMADNTLHMFANSGQFLALLLLAAAALRFRERVARFAWGWLIGCVGLVWLVSRVFPALFEIRYLIFLWPIMGVLVALGLAETGRRFRYAPPLVLALWLAFAVRNINDPAEQQLIHKWYLPPLREVVQELDGLTAPDDALTFHLPPLTPFAGTPASMAYYMNQLTLSHGTLIFDTFATTDAFYAETVREAADDAARLWVTYETPLRNWRMGPVEESILPGAGLVACGTVLETDTVHASLWAAPPDAAPTFAFQGEGGEVRVHLLAEPARRGETLIVNLGYALDDGVLPNQHSVGVHVEDLQGALVAQADVGITSGEFACDIFEIDLPPDASRALLTVYRWETGERLSTASSERPLLADVR